MIQATKQDGRLLQSMEEMAIIILTQEEDTDAIMLSLSTEISSNSDKINLTIRSNSGISLISRKVMVLAT